MTVTTVDALSQLALFADLPRPQVEAVAHSFDEEVFGPGQRVLRRGLSGSSFYVILEGEAAVVIDGDERVRLQRGDFFGEISALLGVLPVADIVASSLLRCLVIPAGELEEFLLTHPTLLLRLLKAEAGRLHANSEWQ